jgi:hypothetical protein
MIALSSLWKKQEPIRPDPELKTALANERGALANNVAALQAGSRVIQNMAGAMQMMAMADKIDDSKN